MPQHPARSRVSESELVVESPMLELESAWKDGNDAIDAKWSIEEKHLYQVLGRVHAYCGDAK